MVRTYEPGEHSNRIPLEYPMQKKEPWYTKIFNHMAWRIFLVCLLTLNILMSFAVLGSLQQIYNTVGTLTDFVGTAIMNPPAKQTPKAETPKPQATQPERKSKKVIPQSFEFLERQENNIHQNPTIEIENNYEHSYRAVQDRRNQSVI